MTEPNCDVVVVGGGSAGCVIASRLTENPDVTVTVLEAGGESGPAAMSEPSEWPNLFGSAVDWGFQTVPQRALGQRALVYPRGKVLGGSSGINAMVHLRGHRQDYDSWEEAGAKGWAYDRMLPYFKRTEDTSGRDSRFRGVGGPMRVGPGRLRHPVSEGAMAALEELRLPLSQDLNGEAQEGGAWLDFNTPDGRRQSAYDGYLRPNLGRPNLRVVRNAAVQSLIIRDSRCTGVDYLEAGEQRRIYAGQVVLCAGTIASPQLLMVSGIGPAAELERLGLHVRADAPEVGRNLHDHVLVPVVYSAAGELPAPTNIHADAAAALRTREGLAQPDVQLLFCDVPYLPPNLSGPANGYSILVSVLQPRSRGTVTLTTTDPADPPAIDPAFFSDQRDVETAIAGLRLARRIGASSAMDIVRGGEAMPGHEFDDDSSLREHIIRATSTYHHPVGTCRLGSDPAAVVDTELRVNGIEGLRVADASVMPTIVSANTNATVLAIAERAAEWIAG
ncbi:GMC family oxidoreductase N-terminal domain-containing protein [Amycolatopsis sp. NPDC005232]|uniref:GMC family oxidoreductase n=1 Tax=Amycolatopsis sp. NPDC005232 TaxID=3157027 RepID=UPI0033AB90EC